MPSGEWLDDVDAALLRENVELPADCSPGEPGVLVEPREGALPPETGVTPIGEQNEANEEVRRVGVQLPFSAQLEDREPVDLDAGAPRLATRASWVGHWPAFRASARERLAFADFKAMPM
jgi:hypothetical protein